MISEGPEKMPHPPKIRCMIQHEGLHPTDYPKDINRYQIVQKEKEGSITYQPQLLVGFLFFKYDFPELPSHYVWAIRFGIIFFVVFALEGFAMGSRLNHNVGAFNENSNWFIVGWSKTVGDLRVAHFIGMHALQVLPILSYYLLKSNKLTIGLSILYGLLALVTLVQAI
jgi:hypothetical protein